MKKDIPLHYSKDVLNSISYSSDKDRRMMKDIVQSLEAKALQHLRQDECVAIPYLGRLRKDAFRKELKKERNALHAAKQVMTTEEYIKYRISRYKAARARSNAQDNAKFIINKLIRLNKKKYQELYKYCGKSYADTWIKCIASMQIVNSTEDEKH